MFCGHEHNFQHDRRHGALLCDWGGGKVSVQAPEPDRFAGAFTVSWAAEGHFLLVEVNGPQMTVVPVGAISPEGTLKPIVLRSPGGQSVATPIVITA